VVSENIGVEPVTEVPIVGEELNCEVPTNWVMGPKVTDPLRPEKFIFELRVTEFEAQSTVAYNPLTPELNKTGIPLKILPQSLVLTCIDVAPDFQLVVAAAVVTPGIVVTVDKSLEV